MKGCIFDHIEKRSIFMFVPVCGFDVMGLSSCPKIPKEQNAAPV